MTSLDQFILNLKYAFRPNKPALVARLTRTVLKSWVSEYNSLRYVDFSLDFACNLKCEHCFATALEEPGRAKMEVEDYARVAEEAMALGAVNFSFQGGETLMVKNLGEIIEACKPWKNIISVTTNGTLINEDRIKWLKSLGVDILTISLDSSVPEEHDKFRGVSGVHARTMKGVELALKSGMRVTLGTVVTHASLKSEGINGLIELAQKLKVILYFIMPAPAGNWSGDGDILLTEDDLDYVYGLTKQSPYLRTDFQANIGRYGCGAAKEILYLTPYGDVLTCPFLHIGFGNVLKEPLAEIRDRALRIPYFADYHQKCLASTDRDFIERYLSKTFHAGNSPLSWREVFNDSETRHETGKTSG